MRKPILNVLAFFVSSFCFSQNDDSMMIRHIADEILLHSKAYDNLHDLTKNIAAANLEYIIELISLFFFLNKTNYELI